MKEKNLKDIIEEERKDLKTFFGAANGLGTAKSLKEMSAKKEDYLPFVEAYVNHHLKEFFIYNGYKLNRNDCGTFTAGPQPFCAIEAIIFHNLNDDYLKRGIEAMKGIKIAKEGCLTGWGGIIKDMEWEAYKKIIPKLRKHNFTEASNYNEVRNKLLDEVTTNDGLEGARNHTKQQLMFVSGRFPNKVVEKSIDEAVPMEGVECIYPLIDCNLG